MDQQAADIAKAVAAGSTGEESNMSFCGSGDSAGGSAVEVKQEPPSPMSPQQTTDEASLMVTLDKNKESLKRKLMMRRSLHELVDQGIYPSPKIPIAFVEQKKSLERAKIGDSLRFKISHRPDRQQLVQQHILEDTNVNVDPSLHERQRQLKKARLADSLNDKLSHRPGVLELVQGNILQTDGKLGQLIKEGSLSFDLEGDAYSYDAAYEDSRSSDDALSPDFTDDSNLSDISSPPAIPPAPELPTSFAKSLGFPAQITFAHDSKVTFSQSTSAFTIPNQTANSTGLSFSGAFSGTGFYTPRNNVTVNTINNNKIKPKKPKPKPPTKAKVIKFHEYKGPPNVVKSTAPVLSTSMPVLGNPATVNSAPVEQKPDPANHSDTPYNILLQQQQLYLQWQLEINQKNLNATVIVPTQKEGQPALVSPTIAASGGFTVGTSVAESPPVSVATKTPTHTVFTVTPTNQHAQPPAQIQQIRIASPGLAQVKSEPQVGQPQPQMNPNITPVTNTTKLVKKPTVTIAQATPQKFYTSLEEMKVPELKAELKKRNLTVSGQKPKLIERLRPYADAILKAPVDKSPTGSVTSPGSSVLSPTGSVISSRSGTSPQPFSVMSPPSAVTSPQNMLMSVKPVVFSQTGSVLSSNASGGTMTLPVSYSSATGLFTQQGLVHSTQSTFKSPGSVNSTVVTSPSTVGSSSLSRSELVMSPVGSVIDEILCGNAESPLASIQSMQSAVSVSNMTLMPDDLSNPFSPPPSPLTMENVMTPLSPDLMDTQVHSPVNAQTHRQETHVQHMHQSISNPQLHNTNNTNNVPTSMEQSRPPSVLSVIQHDPDRIDMDIDLDMNASTSSEYTPVSVGSSKSQMPTTSSFNAVSQFNSLDPSSIRSQQDDQQEMLNHIQAQLKMLQEKQQQKQHQSQMAASQQLSQEELLRQQQEKIEKLQAQLQESQLQLQLQQLQHQQLQHQQQQLQLLQQNATQQQQQTAQQQQQEQQQQELHQQQQQQAQQQQQNQHQQQQQKAHSLLHHQSTMAQQQSQQAMQTQQSLHGQPEVQKPHGQPQVLVPAPMISQAQGQHGQPQVQLSPQHTAVNLPQSQMQTSQGAKRQNTVQVPRTIVHVSASSTPTQTVTIQNSAVSPGQRVHQQQSQPAHQQQYHVQHQQQAKPVTTAPQVILNVPNGSKTPAIGNLANMKQIQIPASWLTNIQSTPHGMSAVIVPQPTSKKAKPPSLEFLKNQAVNQTLNLGPGKSLIAVSNSSTGVPQFIIATAPQPKASPAAPNSTATAPPPNGLIKSQHQKMTMSLPTSPVEGSTHSNVTRTSSNPFFIPMKEPPKYDEAVRNKQSKTPDDAGNHGNQPVENRQTMDDVLEILIRSGELPASAAQEPPPTPNTMSQSPAVPTISMSQSASAVTMYNNTVMSPAQSVVSPSNGYSEMKGNIDSVYLPFEQTSIPSFMNVNDVKTEVKYEPYSPPVYEYEAYSPQTTINVYPPVDHNSDSNDLFDLNDVINSDLNGDLNAMDWTPDPAFGDLDLTDTTSMNTAMDAKMSEQSTLTIPQVHSPQKSIHGSEPDLANLGLGDMDTNSHMQIDVPDWLDVIMPSTGFTPVSANAPVSFPADPILTPQTQKEVLDLFNFDESDLNTPSDLNFGSAWDKLTETTS